MSGVRTVEPANEDTFVRGLSQAIGGPLGEHAVRRTRSLDRFWTPVRIVMVLAFLAFGAHMVQKLPCQTGDWVNYRQYTHFCYTDVLALYYAENLHEGQIPYLDHPVEYPVLTGFLMGALGLPVHSYAATHPGVNPGRLFYNVTAIVLIGFGLATVATMLALRRRRPWDAAMLALAPAMIVTATVNWDLFAIGFTTFFLYAWARKKPIVAGVLLGLAVAAKFYPLFLAGPLLILALRSNRWRHALITVGSAAIAWAAVNAPVYYYAHDGWMRFFQLSDERGIDWGTFWYIGAHLPFYKSGAGLPLFTQLGADIPRLNQAYQLLFVLGCVGIGLLALGARRRPRLAQLCFLVVALFLLTSKVWSQQFVLWLIPLAVLARPKWGAFLFWQVAEVCYFLAFYGELLNASGKSVFPEATFTYVALFRWVGVVTVAAFIIRDILRPEEDTVRRTYGDDPDGGPFDGARDVVTLAAIGGWISRLVRGTRKDSSVEVEEHDLRANVPADA